MHLCLYIIELTWVFALHNQMTYLSWLPKNIFSGNTRKLQLDLERCFWVQGKVLTQNKDLTSNSKWRRMGNKILRYLLSSIGYMTHAFSSIHNKQPFNVADLLWSYSLRSVVNSAFSNWLYLTMWLKSRMHEIRTFILSLKDASPVWNLQYMSHLACR